MSHQSDWIYYKQPIKSLVVKSMVCEKIGSRYSSEWPYLFFYNRDGSIHILVHMNVVPRSTENPIVKQRINSEV